MFYYVTIHTLTQAEGGRDSQNQRSCARGNARPSPGQPHQRRGAFSKSSVRALKTSGDSSVGPDARLM
jgi:hypothetical protein